MGLGLFPEVNDFEEARDDAGTIAKKLIASGLLLDGDKIEQVKMHDVIRDVAILITSLSSGNDEQVFMVQAGLALKEWPNKQPYYKSCTAISFMCNEFQSLPDGPNCPRLQTLLLQDNNKLKDVPSKF